MTRLSYCAELVRRSDPDRFLCALFAPAASREALYALYAFNLEIAKIRVREAALGRMRLQWWRDSVAGIFAGRVADHPVAAALAEAVSGAELSRSRLDDMIDGREHDLDETPPASIEALEARAERTSASLVLLALEAVGVGAEAAREAGRHVGVAWSLSGVLRSAPIHARAGRIFLPRDLMNAHGVSDDDVYRLRTKNGLRRVVRAVMESATRHLETARGLRGRVPKTAISALLPGRLSECDLARIRRAEFNIFDPRLEFTGVGRKFRLAYGAIIGRY